MCDSLFIRKVVFHVKQIDYINEALKQAKKAYKQNEVPVGAVVVYENKIISKGYNKKEKKNNSLYHAEIIAINKACKKLKSWRLSECELYVTLEPCLMCTGLIIQNRISKVYYGCQDNKSGAFGGLFDINNIKGFNYYPKAECLEDEECSKILKHFFKEKRKS